MKQRRPELGSLLITSYATDIGGYWPQPGLLTRSVTLCPVLIDDGYSNCNITYIWVLALDSIFVLPQLATC